MLTTLPPLRSLDKLYYSVQFRLNLWNTDVLSVYNRNTYKSKFHNRGVSHYRILPISRDIGWAVQQLDYFGYKATHLIKLLYIG